MKKYNDILRIIYTNNIKGISDTAMMSKFFGTQKVQKQLEYCIKSGLLTKNLELTVKGRSALTVVLVGGIFDFIHHEHIRLLNAAKNIGDVLLVVVESDTTPTATTVITKPKMLHDERTRCSLVSTMKMVDMCLIGDAKGMFVTVDTIKPDIIVLGCNQSDIRNKAHHPDDTTKVVRIKPILLDTTNSSKNNVVWDVL